MRNLLILLSLSFAVAALYLYAPDLFKRDETQAAPGPIPTYETAHDEDSGDQSAVQASFEHLRDSAQPAPKKTIAKTPREGTHLVRRKAKEARTSALPAAPGLRPAERDIAKKPKEPALDPRKVPVAERNFTDPMRDRWIDDLSGTKVHFSMGKTRVDQSCNANHCDEKRRDNEVSLVGVVVDAERVIERPSRPLEGEFATGRYEDYLPAIYLK